MTQEHKHLKDLLREINGISVDAERSTLTIPKRLNEALVNKLKLVGFDAEEAGKDILELDLNLLPFKLYFDEVDFLRRINLKSWSKPIFLLAENVYFSVDQEKTFRNDLETDNYHLISNNYYCFRFLDFLKTQEYNEVSAFYFVDYFNWDSRHFVLTSLKKDGKIEIILPASGIDVKNDVKLKEAFNEFKNAFNENNKQFPKFIKIELIATLSKVEKNKRMETLLYKLYDIVYVASQNFEIYLHDLSLENLKKDFIEHKNKYFIQLREILSKLTNQIIGLPIAIAASVFSSYKVSNSTSTLLIILGVFIIYAFYSIFLLKLQKEDIEDIKLNFQSDFDKLEDSVYFKKFKEEIHDFKRAKGNLDSRIRSLISALNTYFTFFCISSVAFVAYIEQQLRIAVCGIISTSAVISAGLLVIYILNQTLRKD